MALSSQDRCSRCGAPYISSLLPEETPETRYCYTCDSKVKKENSQTPPSAELDGGLELQALDDSPTSGKDSRIPQFAPSAAHLNATSGFEFLKTAVLACSFVLIAAGIYFALKSKTSEPVASTVPQNAAPVISVVAPPAKSPVVSKTAIEKVKKTSVPNLPKSESNPLGTIGPAKYTGVAAGDGSALEIKSAPAQTTAHPSSENQDLSDIIGKAPRRRAAKIDEDDDDVKPLAKAKAEPRVAENTDAATPADPAEKKDEAAVATADPDKPEKKDMIRELMGKKDEPTKHEMEKKIDPFAPKAPVPVTAEEPTIMPANIEQIGGNDKTMSEQLNAFQPGWHIRDAQFETSKIGISHQGRDNAIILNVMNDLLPAKLLATVEIPAKFANFHPTLRFETSSTAVNKPWMLGIKAMNVDIYPKTRTVMTHAAPWQDVAVDLSGLAGKHFDLEIDMYSALKKAKDIKLEVGIVRNIRLEWTGMKRP